MAIIQLYRSAITTCWLSIGDCLSILQGFRHYITPNTPKDPEDPKKTRKLKKWSINRIGCRTWWLARQLSEESRRYPPTGYPGITSRPMIFVSPLLLLLLSQILPNTANCEDSLWICVVIPPWELVSRQNIFWSRAE